MTRESRLWILAQEDAGARAPLARALLRSHDMEGMQRLAGLDPEWGRRVSFRLIEGGAVFRTGVALHRHGAWVGKAVPLREYARKGSWRDLLCMPVGEPRFLLSPLRVALLWDAPRLFSLAADIEDEARRLAKVAGSEVTDTKANALRGQALRGHGEFTPEESWEDANRLVGELAWIYSARAQNSAWARLKGSKEEPVGRARVKHVGEQSSKAAREIRAQFIGWQAGRFLEYLLGAVNVGGEVAAWRT